MIDDKELIRRALMGDKQAQKECTAKGILLPCPCCKGKAEIMEDCDGDEYFEWNRIYCEKCGIEIDGEEAPRKPDKKEVRLLLAKWNTRPAPHIGKCGECKYFYKSINEKACTNPQGMYFTEITENDFCSYFEPKEESR